MVALCRSIPGAPLPAQQRDLNDCESSYCACTNKHVLCGFPKSGQDSKQAETAGIKVDSKVSKASAAWAICPLQFHVRQVRDCVCDCKRYHACHYEWNKL